MTDILNSLIAYDSSTGEIAGMFAKTAGIPVPTDIQGYHASIHSLTGTMNTYDSDDFDALGKLTETAMAKYNVDSSLRYRIAKDKTPLPTNNYDRVHVTGTGSLDYFSSGPVPVNWNASLEATVTAVGGGALSNDSVTGLPLIPADGTTQALITLQKYDHTGIPTIPNGNEWFSITTDGGRVSYRRVMLDANGRTSFRLTASTEEKIITISINRFFPGPIPTGIPTNGTSVQLFCGDDDYPLPTP